MKEKGNNEKSIVSLIVAGVLLVLLVVFYYVVISFQKEILEIIALCITGIFLLANIYFIIKNNSVMKQSKKMVKKVDSSLPTQSPLEVYLISSIWNHRKITVGEGQISASLLYEISEENILFDKESLAISSKIEIEKLSLVQRYILETVFLDSISNQQSSELKLLKLKHMHYFEAVENDFTAVVAILSGGIAFLNLIEAVTFISNATIINFYVPVVFALFLDPTTIIKSDSFAKSFASFCLKEVEAQIVFMTLNSFEIGAR